MNIVHHHLLYQAKTTNRFNQNSKDVLKEFLYSLTEIIDMECLIPAQLEYSIQNAWTGIIGIVTSHIAFHHWTEEGYLQLDIYSCKEFDRAVAINFIVSLQAKVKQGVYI